MPDSQRKRIVTIAHRGAHQAAAQNTLSSFQAAIDLGIDYVLGSPEKL
jgi:glycerophosphoryl diester phosphodiesterase